MFSLLVALRGTGDQYILSNTKKLSREKQLNEKNYWKFHRYTYAYKMGTIKYNLRIRTV